MDLALPFLQLAVPSVACTLLQQLLLGALPRPIVAFPTPVEPLVTDPEFRQWRCGHRRLVHL